MKKVIVLYRSKYGATKQYVELMQNKLHCDVCKIEKFNFANIAQYDVVIVAGGLYASGVAGIKHLKKHSALFTDQHLIVFAVGASPLVEHEFNEIKTRNLKDIPLDVKMFYGRGAYDETIMNFKDRTLCRMLKRALRKKDPNTYDPWMEAFVEADGKRCNWVDETYLTALYAYVECLVQ